MARDKDYYKTLGVSRGATEAEIQKAYRDLARKHHPDVAADKKNAKKKFQEIQSAFDVLNDPEKRKLYDQYGSDFEAAMGGRGQPPPWARGGPHAGPQGGPDFDFGQLFGGFGGGEGGGGGGFADILEQLGRGGGRRRRPKTEVPGSDIATELTIPFVTAIKGGEVPIRVNRGDGVGETISVKIPAGIEEGKKIRLRGLGEPSPFGGERGDLLILIHVEPHAWFRRHGNDLTVRVPVTLAEASLGAKVDVPSPKGTVSLRVPAGTSSGTRLRIKGYGAATPAGGAGDLYAEILIVVPKELDGESQELVRRLDQRYPLAPRKDLRW